MPEAEKDTAYNLDGYQLYISNSAVKPLGVLSRDFNLLMIEEPLNSCRENNHL